MAKLTVYGTPLCKDCLAMKIIFGQKNVEYDYVNITGRSVDLGDFIRMRDQDSVFQSVKENGEIGIPFFVKEEKKTFDINEALSWEGIQPVTQEEIDRITEECVLICK